MGVSVNFNQSINHHDIHRPTHLDGLAKRLAKCIKVRLLDLDHVLLGTSDNNANQILVIGAGSSHGMMSTLGKVQVRVASTLEDGQITLLQMPRKLHEHYMPRLTAR